MKAQLFVKGIREGIELEDSEALALQAFIIDSSKAHDAVFSIEDIWTGKKGDIKFVSFPKKEKEAQRNNVYEMPEGEALIFQKEIEEDKKKSIELYGNDKDGKPTTFNWKKCHYHRKGAIRLDVFDSPLGFKVDTITVLDPRAYMDLEQKVESFDLWAGKKEFVEKKRIEELEKMSEEVTGEKKI